MEWIIENYMVIVAILLAVSELLALIPAVKSNGIFDMVVKFLQGLSEKKEESEK